MRLHRYAIMRVTQGNTDHVGTPPTTVAVSRLTMWMQLWVAMRLVTRGVAHLLRHGSKRMTSRMAFRTVMRISGSRGTCTDRLNTYQVERWERRCIRNDDYTRLPRNGPSNVVKGVYPCRLTRIRLHQGTRTVRGIGSRRRIGLHMPYNMRLCNSITNNGARRFRAHSAERLHMRL